MFKIQFYQSKKKVGNILSILAISKFLKCHKLSTIQLVPPCTGDIQKIIERFENYQFDTSVGVEALPSEDSDNSQVYTELGTFRIFEFFQ